MNQALILGLVRHILTLAGGALIARGTIDQAQADSAAGAVIALIGVIWSIVEKLNRPKPPTDSATRPGNSTGPLVALTFCLLSSVLFFPGCATNSAPLTAEQQQAKTAARVQRIVKLAVATTAAVELRKHPETRPAFVRAQQGLDHLIEQQRWDVEAVAAVLLTTDLKVWSGPDGQLIVAATMLLIDAVDGGTVDLSQNIFARAVAEGAAAGLKVALPVIKL